jgi:hypothetical protein
MMVKKKKTPLGRLVSFVLVIYDSDGLSGLFGLSTGGFGDSVLLSDSSAFAERLKEPEAERWSVE